MKVTRLRVERFRNLAPTDRDVDAPFVVFHGPNAQGKTNALEAVHLLATLKPLRGRRVRDLVRFGEADAVVGATVRHEGIDRALRIELGPAGRKSALDGQSEPPLAEWFAAIRAVAFTPADAEIVTGDPGRRRNWLDRAVFTASPAHLDRIRRLKRCLVHKSAVLRTDRPDEALLDVLDHELALVGAEIADRRARMLAELAPHLAEVHGELADEAEQLELELHTQAVGADPAERRRALVDKLAAVRRREIDRRTTLAGPQLDDVRFRLDGRAAREFASRGQVRSVVLALKLAEMVAARARGEVPLFLIDDVSSELDAARTARLVQRLAVLGGQVLATTTDPAPMTRVLPPASTLLLSVSAGVLSP
jgi:DNA replication and repair protein RecF